MLEQKSAGKERLAKILDAVTLDRTGLDDFSVTTPFNGVEFAFCELSKNALDVFFRGIRTINLVQRDNNRDTRCLGVTD